jgi:hypothetical protein
MVPDQLRFLVEEIAELSEKQERLLQYLQEVPRDGITYEECTREADRSTFENSACRSSDIADLNETEAPEKCDSCVPKSVSGMH